jgi:hypothetical protein
MALNADDVLAFLADKQPGRAAAARPPGQVRAYREAAAVLISVADLEGLRPVGNGPPPPSVTRLLGPDLVAATGRKFSGTVMLDPRIRTETIRELASADRLSDALAANPAQRDNPFQAHFERYLLGDPPPLQSQSLEELDATRQVAVWLGGVVEGVPTEEEVDARAAYLSLVKPFEAIAGDDVFRGRVRELAILRDFVAGGGDAALSISGPGGVGKSALVARFMLEHTRLPDDERIPFGYLDFDRPGLDVGEPLPLCLELLRQLDVQFPGDDRFADIRARAVTRWGDGTAIRPGHRPAAASDLLGEVLHRMARVLGPRPYVIVLDTFEVVQYRGEARAFPFWDLLAALRVRAPSLRIVVAGRAPVESLAVAGGPVRHIVLGDLDVESAIGFLQAQGIDSRPLCERLVRTFGRTPLTLKLVGSLAARTRGGAGALLDPAGRPGLLVAASDELIQGQLYERILDHIADPQVRRLAHPGLVLRRINPPVILEVLAEPCGLGITTLDQAKVLFAELQRETSLVSVDASDGDLVHRADLRRVMLKMLVMSAPAQVEQIRGHAVAYYRRQPGRRSRAEEWYHRLHLGDPIDPKAFGDREVRASIQAAIAEFPHAVQVSLAALGFDVAPEVRKEASRANLEASAAAQIEELLPYGRSSEMRAAEIFEESRARIRGDSPLFRAGARVAAQLGDDERARKLIEQGLAESIRAGAAGETLELLKDQAWLCRRMPGAGRILALLADHGRRHENRSALLQHKLQTLHAADRRDLAILDELLIRVEPEDVWGLVPAFAPVVDPASAEYLHEGVLRALQATTQIPASPFRYAVFHDPAVQEALDDVLSADTSIRRFADAFRRLCATWPYRILFVPAPYGRRGEQLSESAL